MRRIKTTNQFERDYKRAARRGQDLELLKTVMRRLATGEELEPRYRDHALVGSYAGRRECHLAPDWLLIYKLTGDEIIFERTGSHADLFA